MDAAVNRAVTLVFDYQVDNQEPDKPLRVLAVKLQTNGASKLYEFTAPPDIKGTKVLRASFARAGSKTSRFPRTCSPFPIWGRDELPARFLTHLRPGSTHLKTMGAFIRHARQPDSALGRRF